MKEFIKQYHREIEWGLAAFVVLSSLFVWQSTRELAAGLTVYDIFPPLGLMAFGLMWTHFVMGALRRYFGVTSKGQVYKTVSFGIVLGLIILHPGLLWIALYRDGFGLPPGSHIMAYESQLLAVGLGTVALTIFLSFELRRWFSGKKWWRIVELAQIFGMAAIFYHAIELGGELNVGWYQAVWWFYGVTLAAAIIYIEAFAKRKGDSNGTAVKK